MQTALIAIAVSEYAGSFNDLPGTLNSAKKIQKWAVDFGGVTSENIIEISDRDGAAVTVQRARDEIDEFLTTRIIDRLIIYFAGHGLSTEIGQTWLLTNAENAVNEGIDVAAFARNLRRANIGANSDIRAGQLILIGDACRNYSSSLNHFSGDGIFIRNNPITKKLRQDSFFSTGKGNVSLHISPDDNSSPYCLFSEIMTTAMSGQNPPIEWTSPSNWKVTNFGVADFLEDRVPAVTVARFNSAIEPDIYTQIRPEGNIYSKGELPLPESSANTIPTGRGSAMSGSNKTRITENEIGDFNNNGRDLRAIANMLTNFGSNYLENGEMGAPFTINSFDNIQYFDQNEIGRIGSVDAPDMVLSKHGAPALLQTQSEDYSLIPNFPNTIPTNFSQENGFFLKLLASSRSEYDSIFAENFNVRNSIYLNSKDALSFADELRQSKHSLPHNGVIAAYLYYNVGDYDNIIRIAKYFERDGIHVLGIGSLFCVPFDIALLGASKIHWRRENDGSLAAYADFPEVIEESHPNRPDYSQQGFTESTDVKLWGQVPSFRQGWNLLKNGIFDYEIPSLLREISNLCYGSTVPKFNQEGADLLKEFYHPSRQEEQHR